MKIRELNLNDFKTYPGNTFIHKDADIAEDVEIGIGTIIFNDVIIDEGCKLFERCIIRPNVKIGKNCIIHNGVEIGYNQKKGMSTLVEADSVIRRGSTIYAGNTLGRGFQTGVFAVIRENCNFGKYCSVGTLTQFEGYTTTGNYSRFHTNVHIGQHSEIGNFVWVFPYTVFTNDKYPPYDVCPPFKEHKGPIVKNYAIISTGSILLPGINIGKDTIIGAGSIVTHNVPSGELWVGNPAKFMKKIEEISWSENFAKIIGINKPYPWRLSFKKENYVINDED